MSFEFFLGAYWPARKESIERCADRLLAFFAELVKCDGAFATWYEKGRSSGEALKKPANVESREYLLMRLDRGRNRRDTDHAVIEDLGFRADFWNGRGKGRAASLGVKCGLYSKARLGNCVTMRLPGDLGELGQASRMVEVLAVVARHWEPDWAGVMSSAAMDARSFNAGSPFVDWMVYVRQKIASVPPPSSVTYLGDGGSLIIVQPEPPVVGNADHEARIRLIDGILHRGVTAS